MTGDTHHAATPPGRPLPGVRPVAPGVRVPVVRFSGVAPGGPRDVSARTRGRADEVTPGTGRTTENGATDGTAHHPAGATTDDPGTLVVRTGPTGVAGWAGAVDPLLGHRRAGAALARFLGERPGTGGAAVDPADLTADRFGAVVLGYLLAAHRQDARATDPRPVAPDLLLTTAPPAGHAAALDRARALAVTTVRARELAGAAPDLESPERYAQWARAALEDAGMTVEVLDERRLADEGFGGILAVGGGSTRPPRLVVARRPGPGPRVLLVGKGITFDTGGISIKPATNLHLMRTDMAGSAAVVAAAAHVCAAGPSTGAAEVSVLDLTVVVACAENMPSGSAYRPGDVVTHRDGTTSEVTNTDAEGRMVLADALAHGIEVADPDVVVDVATLTGAMKIALGLRTGAVLGNDDDLARRVSAAGAATGERWWRLPLPDDLREAVRSELADLRQAPKGPGAITAALFLEHFVGGRPWAHLDVAGPARAEQEIDEVSPVATGFAARTLVRLLEDLAADPRPASAGRSAGTTPG